MSAQEVIAVASIVAAAGGVVVSLRSLARQVAENTGRLVEMGERVARIEGALKHGE